jgi:hypothetical protein
MDFIKMKLLIFPLILFIVEFNSTMNSQNLNEDNILKLIRKGYDMENDSSFIDVCKRLNNSIPLSDLIEIHIIPIFNEIDRTTDWDLVGVYEWIRSDVSVCNIELNKNNSLKLDGVISKISAMRNINECLFSSTKAAFHLEKNIPEIGLVKIPLIIARMEVNLEENGFSLKEWSFFFNVYVS